MSDTMGFIGRKLNYWLRGKSRYYIHSPFIFEFVQKVLNDNRHFYGYSKAEGLRKKLMEYDQEVEVLDLGAGSRVDKSNTRKVASIVKNAAISAKAGQLLFRICQHYKPENVLELGTSVGIGTVYLANGFSDSKVWTIEGSPNVAELARTNFNFLKEKNIVSSIGNFDAVLPGVLSEMKQVDLAFIDGNHRKEPTIKYYQSLKPYLNDHSILIFDDIHWSNEMNEAWKWIKEQPEVSVTLDLFRLGIVFFKQDVAKQDIALYF